MGSISYGPKYYNSNWSQYSSKRKNWNTNNKKKSSNNVNTNKNKKTDLTNKK